VNCVFTFSQVIRRSVEKVQAWWMAKGNRVGVVICDGEAGNLRRADKPAMLSVAV
jgi:hypothetical protein